MGLFGVFKDQLERQLEQVYIPIYRGMGMSEHEARGTFKVWLTDAKEQVAKGNRFVARDNFGSDLLRLEATDPEVANYLNALRSEGVLDKDILWFWNMPTLARVMLMRNFEWHVGAMYQGQLRQGRSPEQARIEVCRHHAYYGNPGAEGEKGEDRPIPFELKDRVDTYTMSRQTTDFETFARQMRESSSFNALVRREMRAGRL
jgi:hypothetical protein